MSSAEHAVNDKLSVQVIAKSAGIIDGEIHFVMN
jgi:hypothetical protein